MKTYRLKRRLAAVQQEKNTLISRMADLATIPAPRPEPPRPEMLRWQFSGGPVANLQSPPCTLDLKPEPSGSGFSNISKWRR